MDPFSIITMLSNEETLDLYLIDIVRFAVAAAAVLVLSRI